MRSIPKFTVVLLLSCLANGPDCPAQIPLSLGSYTQDFNSLAISDTLNPWTNNVTLAGWYASRTAPPGVVTNCRASTGTDTTGSIYSFGAAASSERALGSIASGGAAAGNFAYGVRFTNDTGRALPYVAVSYTGEQWRNGGVTNVNALNLSYRVSFSSLTNADAGNSNSWIAVSALDFNSPTMGTNATALDGNTATNRQSFNSVPINGLVLQPGQELFVRWVDADDFGGDHGLAVDDVIVSVIGAPYATTQPTTPTAAGSATLNGMATPNGLPSTAWFEVGGTTTLPVSIGNGFGVVRVSAASPSCCSYDCQLVVSNAAGVTRGALVPFINAGRVKTWGDDSEGQRTVPEGALLYVVTMAGGFLHNVALLYGGTVGAWGYDFYGQTDVPLGLNDVIAVGAGIQHSLALRSNGTVVAWGYNAYNQTNVPTGLSNVVAISAGGHHNLALRKDGTIVGWGYNFYSQTNVPTGLSNVVAIAAGGGHNLALRNNGTVVAWGEHWSGQTNVPSGLTGVVALAAGDGYSLALKSNGAVVAWGDNGFGQTNVPPDLTDVRVIAAGPGSSHCLALKNDLTVVAWGYGGYGQTNPPPGLRNVWAIAAGGRHSLALGESYDDFFSRGVLDGSDFTFQTSNLGATREPDEPQHSSATGSSASSVWYQWIAPKNGGVIIQATTTGDLLTPILAVYTNTTLATLGRVADNSSKFQMARVAFTAVSNQAYQIALDSIPNFGGTNQGIYNVSLTISNPPVNDLFAGRTPVAGNYYATSGSFLGAGRELGESNHGAPDFAQTLWWTWTAPTNAANSTVPVRLMADAVSFAPAIGVYTGNNLASLTSVNPVLETNGFDNGAFSMTRTATFTATPGTTYQIALAGQQHDPAGNIISPRYGDFRLRLNVRALSLSVTNGTATANFDGSRAFTGVARVSNLGPIASHALRLRVSSLSGVGVQGQDTGYQVNDPIFWTTNDLGSMPSGQTVDLAVAGTIPAKIENTFPDGSGTGVGYGAFIQLEEQPFPGAWFTVDHALAGFDDWPTLGVNPGPGGGVIRLDPNYVGLSLINPLTSVAVLGPLVATEGGSNSYAGLATYRSGALYQFTNTAWSVTNFAGLSPPFAITTNGMFTVGNITSNAVVAIRAPYSNGGFLYTATASVTVSNLPPPSLIAAKFQTNKSFTFTVSGVPGRSNLIEATTNLTPPIAWTNLATNVLGTDGLLNFTNSFQTNFPRRFYRALEL